jgi:hypothetical protein
MVSFAAGGAVLLAVLLAVRTFGSADGSDKAVPSNGWILYEAREQAPDIDQSDIYMVAEGIAPRRVLGEAGDGTDQSCPAFSPDGSQFTYIDGGDLVIARLEGGGAVSEDARFARQLDPRGPCPRWSPDGSEVAFLVQGSTSLRILDLGMGPERASIFGPYIGGELISDLEWAADGATVGIAYEGTLLAVPIEGNRLLRLIAGSNLGADPGDEPQERFSSISWSPITGLLAISGSTVVPDGGGGFADQVDGEFMGVANSVGRGLRLLPARPVQGAGYEIAWSPDGSAVAYVERGAGLKLIGRDGSGVASGYPLSPASGVAWSPDGRRMLHMVADPWRLVSVSTDPATPPVELAAGDALGGIGPDRITWQPVQR